MIAITNESDFNAEAGLVVVKFWAAWCGPCKKLEPVITKMEDEFKSVQFLSVNIDQVPNIASKYRVRTLPTILFLRNGREVSRTNGIVMLEALRKTFRDFTKE